MTWLNEPPERRTAAVMKQKGYIDAGEEGRSSKSVRVPEFGKQRLYHIRSTFLEDANEA
jgi:putative DNA primase/helicase